MSLAEVGSKGPTRRTVGDCGRPRPLARYKKADLEDPEARCAACRVPCPIADPEISPSRVMCNAIDLPLPDSWRAKMASGVNFRCEVRAARRWGMAGR